MGDKNKKNESDGLLGKIFWGVAAGAVGAAVVAAGVSLASKNSNTPVENTPVKLKKDVVVVIINATSLEVVKLNAIIEDPQPITGPTNTYNTVVVKTTSHLQKKLEHNKNFGHLVITIYYSNGKQDQFRIKSIFTDLYRFESIMRTHNIDLIRKSNTAFQITVRNPPPVIKRRQVQQSTPDPSQSVVAAKYVEEGNRLVTQAFEAELDTQHNRSVEVIDKFYEASFKFHDAIKQDNRQEYRNLITMIDIKIQGNYLLRKANELEESIKDPQVLNQSGLIIKRQALEKYQEAMTHFEAALQYDLRISIGIEKVRDVIKRIAEEITRYELQNNVV